MALMHALLALLTAAQLAQSQLLEDNLFSVVKALVQGEEDLSLTPDSSLLENVTTALGPEVAQEISSRLLSLEAALRPGYAAMAKNRHGRLGQSATRYLLHRFFVQRHGWFVHGLDTRGEAWNASSPTLVLRGHVPDALWESFESRLVGGGFSLSDTSVFAALMEVLVHEEVDTKIDLIYSLYALPKQSSITRGLALTLLEVFLSSTILDTKLNATSLAILQHQLTEIGEVYPAWRSTQSFLRSVLERTYPDGALLKFEDVAQVVQEVSESWGPWANRECLKLKGKLVALESENKGCVHLSRFYSSLLAGNWQFGESPGYLREQGILEDSIQDSPRVLIPNYINSKGNCVASSSYFLICCLNECEELVGHMEEHLVSHQAKPEDIIALVQMLPSRSVVAPRTLSPRMVQQLQDIALMHRGSVPLHGHLFAQWMHHAYPRECPYPRFAGTTNNSVPWKSDGTVGDNVVISEEAAREIVTKAQGRQSHAPQETLALSDETCAPWHSVQEELYVPTVNPYTLSSLAALEDDDLVWMASYRVAAVTLAACALLLFLRALWSVTSAAKRKPVGGNKTVSSEVMVV